MYVHTTISLPCRQGRDLHSTNCVFGIFPINAKSNPIRFTKNQRDMDPICPCNKNRKPSPLSCSLRRRTYEALLPVFVLRLSPYCRVNFLTRNGIP